MLHHMSSYVIICHHVFILLSDVKFADCTYCGEVLVHKQYSNQDLKRLHLVIHALYDDLPPDLVIPCKHDLPSGHSAAENTDGGEAAGNPRTRASS